MTKPLTKALHTTRIVQRVALYLLRTKNLQPTEQIEDIDWMLDNVLDVLGNERPTDPELLRECQRVIRAAIRERNEEV